MWKMGTSQTWWLWWVLNDKNITLTCSYVPHCWSNNSFGSLMITVYSFNNIWATISHSFATIIIKKYKHVHRYWHISNSYLTGNALSNDNSLWAAMYNQPTLWCNGPTINPSFKDGIHINSRIAIMVISVILLKLCSFGRCYCCYSGSLSSLFTIM